MLPVHRPAAYILFPSPQFSLKNEKYNNVTYVIYRVLKTKSRTVILFYFVCCVNGRIVIQTLTQDHITSRKGSHESDSEL